MKIQVLFGSASDENVFQPLVEGLRASHEVSFEVLSAHRDPDALEALLKSSKADLFVCGAGLAAHLPGVVASKVKQPVLGVAVNSQFGGIDAFLSIAQMPRQIPVLGIAPGQEKAIGAFLAGVTKENFTQLKVEIPSDIKNQEWLKSLQEKMQLASPEPIQWVESLQGQWGIQFVRSPQDVVPANICVYVGPGDEFKKMEAALDFYRQSLHGGLWVGTNNVVNAVIMWQKLKKLKG